MTRFVLTVVLLAIAALFPSEVTAQNTYVPGQTFSSSNSPTPAPVPYRNTYIQPQRNYQPPVQQQQPVYRTPVPRERVPQPRRSPRESPASSLYNMKESDRTEKPSRSRSRSSESSDEEDDEKKQEIDKSSKETTTDDDDNQDVKQVDKEDKPVVPDSTDKLTFFERKTGKKWIALTYDDGPNPSFTPKLMKYLKENNVPATFYLLGEMVKAHPEVAKELADNGFELANHSYDHPDLRKKSSEQILKQLQDTHDLIKEATGVDVKTMRPPYGAHNSKVDAVCKKMGYKIILWDVDTEDWKKRSADAIMERIHDRAGDGSIILMHDRLHAGRETVLEATRRTVEEYRAKGYTFVTIEQLIGLDEPQIAGAGSSVRSSSVAPANNMAATSATATVYSPVPAVPLVPAQSAATVTSAPLVILP